MHVFVNCIKAFYLMVIVSGREINNTVGFISQKGKLSTGGRL